MRDVELWQRLTSKSSDTDDLLPLLDGLTEVEPVQRAAMLGVIDAALVSNHAGVRQRAVAALAGASGVQGYERIVAALDDESPDVRRVAVEALFESAGRDRARWAHAAFHQQLDVRRAAAHRAVEAPALHGFNLYLLADNQVANQVRASLADMTIDEAMIPIVVTHAKTGLIDRKTARRLVATANGGFQLANMFEPIGGRSIRDNELLVDWAKTEIDRKPPPIEDHADPLDAMFDLFWEPEGMGDDEDDDLIAEFFKRIFKAITIERTLNGVNERRAIMAALIACASRQGWWSPRAAAVAVVAEPRFVRMHRVSVDVRRHAIHTLYEHGHNMRRQSAAMVQYVLRTDIARRPSGNLDLWVVGGVLKLIDGPPYEQLLRWFGADAIKAAFREDVVGSIPFLSLNDDSARGQAYMVALLANLGDDLPTTWAHMMAILPADGWSFLKGLPGGQALAIAARLLDLESDGTISFSDRRRPVAAAALTDLMLQSSGAQRMLQRVLRQWMDFDDPGSHRFAVALVTAMMRELAAEEVADTVKRLDDSILNPLLDVLPTMETLPFSVELAVAHALVKHRNPVADAWAKERLTSIQSVADKSAAPRSTGRIKSLTVKQANVIRTCSEKDLPSAVEVALTSNTRGLATALAERAGRATPSVEVCIALLASHDPLPVVAEQFERYWDTKTRFTKKFDRLAVKLLDGRNDLPLQGRAWLYRWERHAFSFGEAVTKRPGGIQGILDETAALPVKTLAQHFWLAVTNFIALGLARAPDETARLIDGRMLHTWVEALPDRSLGGAATRALHFIHKSKRFEAELTMLRPRVEALLPDIRASNRLRLRLWINSIGLADEATRDRASLESAMQPTLVVAAADGLEKLCQLATEPNPTVAADAVLALVEAGDAGIERLLAMLDQADKYRASTIDLVADSVPLWPMNDARLDRLEAFVNQPNMDSAARFRIALAVHTYSIPPRITDSFKRSILSLMRGDTERITGALNRSLAAFGRSTASRDMTAAIIDLINDAPGRPWFKTRDWDDAVSAGLDPFVLACATSISPQPHAYRCAVNVLLEKAPDSDALDGLQRFIEAGSERQFSWRVKAAKALTKQRMEVAEPILFEAWLRAIRRNGPGERLVRKLPDHLIDPAISAVLISGPFHFEEPSIVGLAIDSSNPLMRERRLLRILKEASLSRTRLMARKALPFNRARTGKLQRLANTFAWGVRTGRELTGRMFNIALAGEEEMGYTRLNENRIFINPLPMLTGQTHGRDVVEGLIIHEYGHHVYHRGPENEAVWDKAKRAGMMRLLNLVSDEHLERNLRAMDDDYGDRLKRLCAFAFQHAARDVNVDELLAVLGPNAAPVLTSCRLDVSRKEGCVLVAAGPVMVEMERAGMSFARFMRALRMGLGNRHNDPKVREALDLFDKKFRRLDMDGLYEIAEFLRIIFGDEAKLLDLFDQDRMLLPGEDGMAVDGDGITDNQVQREVERILNPRKHDARGRGKGGGGKVCLNVNPDENFDKITNIVPIPHDPAAHATYAGQVARHAAQLRQHLRELGLAMVPTHQRTAGHRVDRARLHRLAIHADPRILIARERRVTTDLFIGTVIDCSGSMQMGERIERGKLFGTLIAEAARGLAGVDCRTFGFTDHEIYDAGTGNRCSVHGLTAGGGNNDAAALWHAAQEAERSKRRAKLLVMISDGLPTECSVAALRALVQHLSTRRKVCCAQVAVAELEEVCFPHYVLLNDADLNASVREFGRTVARLVRRVLT